MEAQWQRHLVFKSRKHVCYEILLALLRFKAKWVDLNQLKYSSYG